jgi:hypothetical protein
MGMFGWIGLDYYHFFWFIFVVHSFIYLSNQLFLTCTFPDADPLGTFLNRRLGAPHGGQYQLSGNSAHALGPLVNTYPQSCNYCMEKKAKKKSIHVYNVIQK